MENHWAKYEFSTGQSPVPGLSHLVLSLHGGVAGPNSWIQLEFFGPNSRLFGISFLVTSLKFLYPGIAKTRVFRYLLYPEAGNALEFVSKASGEALTPKLGFLEHLLPRADSHTDQEMPFFASGTYLGQSIRKIEVGNDAHTYSTEGVKRLVLDEEILIGTSRPFRDTGVGRLHPAGHPWQEDDDDYE